VTISAPTTGVPALTINQYNGVEGVLINAPAGYSAFEIFAPNGGAVAGYVGSVGAANALATGSAVGDMVLRTQGGNLLFDVNGGGTSALVVTGTTGAVTINTPTGTNTALTVNGSAGGTVASLAGTATVGGFGLFLTVGNSAGDYCALFKNAANTVTNLAILGNGAITFGAVATTTTAPGAGGAGALPATPKGYFSITIGTYAAKVPYY
jgi:hypothetical protein